MRRKAPLVHSHTQHSSRSGSKKKRITGNGDRSETKLKRNALNFTRWKVLSRNAFLPITYHSRTRERSGSKIRGMNKLLLPMSLNMMVGICWLNESNSQEEAEKNK